MTKVCIDDFAMKKRHKYGTVMVDIETHTIVDILDSREVDKVAEWLKEFKNITAVSRDGSVLYNSAIQQAFPNAIQISDRFHLLKALTEHLKKELKRLVKNSINVYTEELLQVEEKEQEKRFESRTKGDLIREVQKLSKENYSTVEICNALSLSKHMVKKYKQMKQEEIEKYDKPSKEQIRKEKKCDKIWELAQKIQEEYKKCKNYSRVGGKLDIDYRTVKRYLEIKERPTVSDLERLKESKLSKYVDTIIKMSNDGATIGTIYEKIKQEGYEGKQTILKVYLADLRKKQKSKYKILSNVSVNTLISLLYKGVEKVKNITQEIFDKIKEQNINIANIYYIIESFRTVLFSKQEEKLDLWIEEIKKLNIDEVNKFIAGIERDKEAIKSAIKLDYNNGLAEGSVNKIKVVKRIMYGRCSHELLKQKLLIK